MLLNTLDLLVCLAGAITFSTLNLDKEDKNTIREIIQLIFIFLNESTGFTTCILSAIRCIGLYSPFYKVNKVGVAISAGVFMGIILARDLTLLFILDRKVYERIFEKNVHLSIILGDIGLMIAVTLIVNTISMVTLFLDKDTIPAQSRASSVKATITVAILSVLFCFFNVFYMIGNVLGFNKSGERNYGIIGYFGIFYAIPCNSAINPLIYLIRKKDMKEYILSLVRKRRERPDVQGASRQATGLSNIAASTLSASNRAK